MRLAALVLAALLACVAACDLFRGSVFKFEYRPPPAETADAGAGGHGASVDAESDGE